LKPISNPAPVEQVGRFERSSLREQSGQEFFIYHFSFDESANQLLRSRRNAQVVGELAYQLKKASTIVPKVDLVRTYPEVFRSGQWATGVQEIWLDAVVVAVGSTDLAIAQELPKTE
jgi:hypothetical protein